MENRIRKKLQTRIAIEWCKIIMMFIFCQCYVRTLRMAMRFCSAVFLCTIASGVSLRRVMALGSSNGCYGAAGEWDTEVGEDWMYRYDAEGNWEVTSKTDSPVSISASFGFWFQTQACSMNTLTVSKVSNFGPLVTSTTLHTVTFDDNLVELGNMAFQGCTALTTVNNVQNLQTIGKDAFNGCTNIKSLVGGSKLQTLGQGAFQGTGIKRFDMRKCPLVSNLPASLFANSQLEEFIGGSGLTTIDSGVFPTTLKGIDLSACTELILLDEPYSYGLGLFADMTSLHTVKLPKLESLPYQCFYGCTALRSIDLDVVSLHGEPFTGCEKLTSLTMGPSLEEILEDALGSLSALKTLDLRACLKLSHIECLKLSHLEVVHLPTSDASVGIELGDECFLGLALVELTGTESLKIIGSMAFAYCSISEITLTQRVVSIGTDAFMRDEPLTLTYTGSRDFSNGRFFGTDTSYITVIVTRDYPSDTFGGVEVTRPLSAGAIAAIVICVTLVVAGICTVAFLLYKGILQWNGFQWPCITLAQNDQKEQSEQNQQNEQQAEKADDSSDVVNI